MKIKCSWREKKQVLINPDGQVYPCCFLANVEYFLQETKNNQKGYEYPYGRRTVVMNNYNEHKSELNLKNNEMKEILEHDWWKFLEKSWDEPDKTDRRCIRFCGIKE